MKTEIKDVNDLMLKALKEIVLFHRTGGGNVPLFDSSVRQAEEAIRQAESFLKQVGNAKGNY